MTRVPIKKEREREIMTDRQTQRKDPEKTPEELSPTRQTEGPLKDISSTSPESWKSILLNCEEIHFSCLSHPVS